MKQSFKVKKIEVEIEQKPEMHIAYHGTSVTNAKSILKTGLQEYSYYTPYLNTALGQGGPVIFIWYILDPWYREAIKLGQWEFRNSKIIRPDEFIAVVHYQKTKLVTYNKELKHKLKLEENPNICPRCLGHGELNYPDDGHVYLPGGCSLKSINWKVERCPECKGYGIINEDTI
jgi:hypothetical protein